MNFMWKRFINISHSDKIKDYYKRAYKDLYNTYRIQTINITINQEGAEKNIEPHITQIYKKTLEDVIEFLKNTGESDNVYINTFEESLTSDIHYIKNKLGQVYTLNHNLFTDKSIERSVAKKNQKYQIIPEYITGNLNEIIKQEKIHFPYIIKPTHGVQSSGVGLMTSHEELQHYKEKQQKIQDKGLKIDNYIIEEYIDGPMYTMTYFVDSRGRITLYSYDKVETLYDIGINDFSLFARIIEPLSNDIIQKMQKIAQETVEIFSIRNVFVHHESKYQNEQTMKLVEINGRIGGFRVEMYDYAYGINLLEYTISGYKPIPQYKKNVIAISLRPNQNNVQWIGINQDIWQKIESLPSYKKSKILKQKLHTTIGFSKYGHTRVGSIILENENHEQLMQDYKTIKNVYADILLHKDLEEI